MNTKTIEIANRLQNNPELLTRVESLLNIVEDAGGDLKKAADAEMRVIEELRKMGNEALTSWGKHQSDKATIEADQDPTTRRMGEKKLYWHSSYGKIVLEEVQYRRDNKRFRPFSRQAEIVNRGCSIPLQRIVTDFGADVPFGQVPEKLKEHYGIEVATSVIARITEQHARVFYQQPERVVAKEVAGQGQAVIVEMDGSMVPVVISDLEQKDKRKGKTLQWNEVKLCLAHQQGSQRVCFGGNFSGGVEQAGKALRQCAVAAGFDQKNPLHAVGDGAVWITEQIEQQFGADGHYLVDFYHVCDYLAEAATRCAADTKAWLEDQKTLLKTNQHKRVLINLLPHIEPPEIDDKNAPVRRAHRYLSKRAEQLDYQSALEKDLPIGSGEIESAHRYIIQQRLKRAGSWWTPANIDGMLALRLARANNRWNDYWAAEMKSSMAA